MTNRRVWLFRILIVIATASLVAAWFMPWWSASIKDIPAYKYPISIYPYGLDAHLMWEYLTIMPEGGAEAEMPAFFTPVMWLYFGLVVAALLIAAWLVNKDRNISLFRRKFNLSKFLMIVVGLSYMVVCGLAVIVASMRLGDIGINLVGYTFVNLGHYAVWTLETSVDAYLRFGYWLACGVGPFLIILALLRNRIVGRSTSVSQ